MDTRCGPALNMRGGYTVFCLKSAYGVSPHCGLSFHQFKKAWSFFMKTHTALAGTHSINPLYYKEPATALSREAASYGSNIRMIFLNERHAFS